MHIKTCLICALMFSMPFYPSLSKVFNRCDEHWWYCEKQEHIQEENNQGTVLSSRITNLSATFTSTSITNDLPAM